MSPNQGISDQQAFEVHASDGLARAGVLRTRHGDIQTPAFAPVGTLGSVKGLTPSALGDLEPGLMLANFYHLALRPGVDRIVQLGGLHSFTGWDGPILTDSGGFQVFSLASLRTIDERGVRFRNHLDGGEMELTPEGVASAQAEIGVDIAMMLDECPPWPAEKEEVGLALDRTLGWAARGCEEWDKARASDQKYFGIVQGGVFRDLRERAVESIGKLDFDGYAIGGVSVGEPDELRARVVEWTAPLLPPNKPRYLMGVGTPGDLLHAVRCGIDLFDCVMPSRNARHGMLFTRQGELRIKNASFAADGRPIDEECRCPTCRTVNRAFVHHLLRHKELTGIVLATTHNIAFFLDFMKGLREAIASGRLSEAALPGAPPEA